ncbi:excinuclease ABC subunit UvrA [Xenorhabdus nematophila]|uniref:ATP-binding cassette domain-containing protein n=2 Tax=Xenorhabdus nematophila TaxID=628 RepID=UPI0005AB4A2E|nr:excinuclease ABC subunit UvrA [Xenorhabdus nematophila]AYA41177.1 ATP-binding cassette domain-containing protein [Xenorhabdus nematophila]MBA0019920.1 excinuclease ABC subunit UvrA [Xenorhabdus nematophila]MCB4425979.1 ATP-binding cassette domain-containing protein [Xenorhabdus nematophila]QNJ35578.1 excinuclease ABC subunit UvrA [Xenorhabdus nematophila]
MRSHEQNAIEIRGARQNNLKGIDLRIPKNVITVFTGVSGSGKSSLVFGTIAAESQRQLNDTFPPYIRHRLPYYGQPDVDEINNLTTAIIINQKRIGENVRSTVGTASDIYTLLRLLFSRMGKPFVGFSNIFSFNHPSGMCPHCEGLGIASTIDVKKLVNEDKSLNGGAIEYPTFAPGTWRWRRYAHSGLFDNNKKISDYSAEERQLLLYADNIVPTTPSPDWPKSARFEGIIPRFTRSYLIKNNKEYKSEKFRNIVSMKQCPVCHGQRLNKPILSCLIQGKNIGDCVDMPIVELNQFMATLADPSVSTLINALKERLASMCSVGLGYLTLNRPTTTLSGGEAQRLKMVRHLGSSLTGMTYIIDEPSTGLHPADITKLNMLIQQLRDKGNTILMVEHDPDVIKIADHIIDLGPEAGDDGGTITYQGDLNGLRTSGTLTGKYLFQTTRLNQTPKKPIGYLPVRNATLHNLKEISIDIPLGIMLAVSGVAGSGKSSMMMGEVVPLCANAIIIDQKPIHTSKRSHIASWSGVFDHIRERFAMANRVDKSWFSPNAKGGCSECKGLGVIETDLAFMDSISLPCEACQGQKFNQKALHYKYKGKTIVDLMNMSITQATDFFAGDSQIHPTLVNIQDVGLGYMRLGESLAHLSGGECQRLKLASYLNNKGNVYIFDEPTTGLHPSDVTVLITLFHRLVEQGNSVMIIEHNMDVIAQADWVIDLGEGAGTAGGQIMFSGTPQAMFEKGNSLTADYLRQHYR